MRLFFSVADCMRLLDYLCHTAHALPHGYNYDQIHAARTLPCTLALPSHLSPSHDAGIRPSRLTATTIMQQDSDKPENKPPNCNLFQARVATLLARLHRLPPKNARMLNSFPHRTLPRGPSVHLPCECVWKCQRHLPTCSMRAAIPSSYASQSAKPPLNTCGGCHAHLL